MLCKKMLILFLKYLILEWSTLSYSGFVYKIKNTRQLFIYFVVDYVVPTGTIKNYIGNLA